MGKRKGYARDDFNRDDYSEDDYRDLGWTPGILAAASAIYGRLHLHSDKDTPTFSNTDIDTLDHYCIAAENAINAYKEEAEVDNNKNKDADSA